MAASTVFSDGLSKHQSVANEIISVKEDEERLYKWRERTIFPFFADIYQKTLIPHFFFYIHIIVNVVQVFSSAFLFGSVAVWQDIPPILRYFYYSVDWGSSRKDFSEIIYQMIAGISVCGFIFFFIYFVELGFIF